MMNREEFLKALQERIAMLEQAEQQDILAEYAQHIEMQIQDGFTEEEAIRDFGSLDELAAEILEAYHIDPAYQPGTQEAEKPEWAPDPVPKVRFRERLAGGWHCVCNKVQGWFHREPKPKKVRESKPVEKQRDYSGFRRGCIRVWNGLKRGCKAVVWVFWNGLLLLCAVPIVSLVLCAVIGFGLLVVLLAQGYPLIGVTLMTVGAGLCCGAVLYLGWGLVWHRAAPTAPRETPEFAAEVTEQISKTVCAVEQDAEEEADHA